MKTKMELFSYFMSIVRPEKGIDPNFGENRKL